MILGLLVMVDSSYQVSVVASAGQLLAQLAGALRIMIQGGAGVKLSRHNQI